MNAPIPKFKKLSTRQQRDFDAYCKIAENCKAYQIVNLNRPDYYAKTIEEWFVLWDTHGIRCNMADIQMLQTAFKIVQAKATLNLTIKLWIEDVIEAGNKNIFPIITPIEIKQYCEELPSWVYPAFSNQLKKHNLIWTWQQP